MIYSLAPKDFHPEFQIAVCICQYNDTFLLLQRQIGKGQENQWGVPAGKLEVGELPGKAARRELFEETGINVPLTKFNYIDKMFDRYPTFDFIINLFSIKLNQKDEVILNKKEHQNYKWVTLTEALKMDYMEDLDILLKNYFKVS